ncbi:hypothetical protein CCACVL1_03523 [Corchorus capsularis]|uniref:Uncharacterized protein n=1 Tax=Corchorus capsularis TaxID=210143 RepID=A0A1R3JYR6_COCAP|nr:hypothetical protein CCACVL1_03523 [Corchorus capsularis]
MAREPIMSWTTTYEDLLCSTEPFQQPIPLAMKRAGFLPDACDQEPYDEEESESEFAISYQMILPPRAAVG